MSSVQLEGQILLIQIIPLGVFALIIFIVNLIKLIKKK